jgi:hypothetical protein
VSQPPGMWLLLDLCPRLNAEAPAGDTVHELLADAEVARGGQWIRSWAVATTREQAREWVIANPTLVVMPLVLDDRPGDELLRETAS